MVQDIQIYMFNSNNLSFVYNNLPSNLVSPDGMVELYSLQNIGQYKNLMENGFITGSSTVSCMTPLSDSHSKYCCFRYAYAWIKDVMLGLGLEIPQEVIDYNADCGQMGEECYPVWAWYQHGSSSKRRPDLRYSGYNERGTEMCLLTFRKPLSDILLSDFDMWHYVLNKWLLPHNDIYKKLEQTLDSNEPYKFFSELIGSEQDMIKESWYKIFDLQYYDPDICDPLIGNKSVQCTMWSINAKDITDIQFFKCR